MTTGRAAVVSALAAVLLYAPSVGNQFALDDHAIIRANPNVHSVGAALRAYDETYWPRGHDAGLWRPLTILSFALDWTIGGGSPHLLHATNVVLHGGVTSATVAFIAPYVGPAGALAGGLLFAVHPVHVEAVANLVGRAELLAALAVLGALLLARVVVRRRQEGRGAVAPELGVLACLAAGLLSKEHAVVTIALIGLDDVARSPTLRPRLPWRTYAMVALLSLIWFVARQQVDDGRSFRAMAPTFYGLDTVGRLSTMLPVFLTVVRLSVWPMDLSLDYHPQVVSRLESPDAAGLLALVLIACLTALAVVCWRRERPVTVALVFFAVAWLPTANVFFPSGIVLSERTLYLASAGLAMLAGLAAARLEHARLRRHATVVAAAIALVFAGRTWSRVPVWYGSREVVLNALDEKPESYMAHMAAGRAYIRMGQMDLALREFGIAAELYRHDHLALAEAGIFALRAGRPRLAVRFLEWSREARPDWSLPDSLLREALQLATRRSQPAK